MTPFECYKIYVALKTHFNKESFSFLENRITAKLETFERRKDTYIFTKISKKFNKEKDYIDFLVANLVYNSNFYIEGCFDSESETTYNNYIKTRQSLSYTFKNELEDLLTEVDNFEDMFLCSNRTHPLLLKKLSANEIRYEVAIIINKIVNFVPYFDKKLSNDIMWPSIKLKMNKLECFMKIDVKKYRKIFKDSID